MRTRPILCYLLCFLAFQSSSYGLEERSLYINFSHFENFVGKYLVKEIDEARAQITTITDDSFHTKLFKKNCHRQFYFRFDKKEHSEPYLLKNNIQIQIERDRILNLGPVISYLKNHLNVLAPLIHSKCKVDSYLTVLLYGKLRNGHDFRSDFFISFEKLNKDTPGLKILIKDERQNLSIKDLNQAILGPSLLSREEEWQGVWEELDPLASSLQINTPLLLK